MSELRLTKTQPPPHLPDHTAPANSPDVPNNPVVVRNLPFIYDVTASATKAPAARAIRSIAYSWEAGSLAGVRLGKAKGKDVGMYWIRSAAAVSLSLVISTEAAAQTQSQQDRLDRVSQFLVTAPICERLGMKLDPDLPSKAEEALDQETSSWQVDAATVKRLKSEALSRQGAMLRTDLDAAADAAKTDVQLRNVRNILLSYGRNCMAATVDPIYSRLITLPPEYDLEKAVTNTSDGMLEGGGLASWQTPRIQARGDLMMLAGTCRSKIGVSRSDDLMKEFGQSDDPRVRGYYRNSFDEGLSDPTIISTLAGCNRAIQQLRLKAR